jgi:hypothetical protein
MVFGILLICWRDYFFPQGEGTLVEKSKTNRCLVGLAHVFILKKHQISIRYDTFVNPNKYVIILGVNFNHRYAN